VETAKQIFGLKLESMLVERRVRRSAQPNPRHSPVPLAPCQVQLQSAKHGEGRGEGPFVPCSLFSSRIKERQWGQIHIIDIYMIAMVSSTDQRSNA
jgi:hypothetical protein